MADRYAFAPLEALVLVDVGPRLNDLGQHASRTRLVAEVLGVDRRQVIRWRASGVTADQADRLAVAAHRHAFEVWPELADVAARVCARQSCTVQFVPGLPHQKYCCDRCRKGEQRRRNMLRRYRTDPEFAEKKRERRRVYYAECGEYERARERQRYAQRTEAA